jgi:hypothetical protein
MSPKCSNCKQEIPKNEMFFGKCEYCHFNAPLVLSEKGTNKIIKILTENKPDKVPKPSFHRTPEERKSFLDRIKNKHNL